MDFTKDVTITDDGMLRWKSNDMIPNDYVLEYLQANGCNIDIEKCAKQREIEIRNILHLISDGIRNYVPFYYNFGFQ